MYFTIIIFTKKIEFVSQFSVETLFGWDGKSLHHFVASMCQIQCRPNFIRIRGGFQKICQKHVGLLCFWTRCI